MAEAHAVQQGSPLPAEPLTVAEFFERYTDQPAEVVNGEVILVSPNTRTPMQVGGYLHASMLRFALEHNLGKVAIETAYVLDADDRTDWVRDARQPDISFVSKERAEKHDAQFGKGGPWRLAPDIAIEIVSPTDDYSAVMEKVLDYLRYGVRLGIIIDPQTRTVQVFSPDNPGGVLLRESDILRCEPMLPGWSMPLAELFGAAE
jgi:Uma2 family endonuclease